MKLLIGVSLAALAVATPATARQYYIDRCTVNHNENWILVFDVQHTAANFWRENSSRSVHYGTYYSQDGATYINVSNDTAPTMDLKLRSNHDPSGNPVLEWASDTIRLHSMMLCVNIDDTDIRPDRWIDPPHVPPAYVPPAYVPTISTPVEAYVPPNPDVKVIVDPKQSTSTRVTVALSSDGFGGHTVDVVLGTNTPVTMLVDTGATMVSLPQERS